MKNLPYHQTFDGNYWISRILWNLFKGHFDVTKNFLFFNFPKKPLKNFPLKVFKVENAFFGRLQNPRQSEFGSLISPHDLRSGWFLCKEMMDTNTGSWSFASEPNHGLFLGYGFEFAWRRWVAYFITLCWRPVSRIDSTYWTCQVVFKLRLWRNFAWKKLQCLKFLP